MFAVAFRASLLFGVIIAVWAALQTDPIVDVALIFLVGGIIPGTSLELPAEIMLVTVAAALMTLTAVIVRRHLKRQAALQVLMREYDTGQEDPSFESLVPGLGALQKLGRTAKARMGNTALHAYTRLQNYGRAVIAQAITVRGNPTHVLLEVGRRAPDKERIRRTILSFFTTLRRWEDRARAYVARVTALW